MRTTATTATLFGNSAPIFVGIGTWIFFRRRPQRNFWTGLMLAMGGAAIVMVANASAATARPATCRCAHVDRAAVCFAVYLLATEHVREEMDTLTFSTVAVAGSMVTLLVVCFFTGAPLAGFTSRTWAALLGLGLISQLGAYLGLAYALGHLPATVTSVGLAGAGAADGDPGGAAPR